MKKLFLLVACALLTLVVACTPQKEAKTDPVVLYDIIEVEFDVELAEFQLVLDYAAENGYTVAYITRNPLINTLTATFKVSVA